MTDLKRHQCGWIQKPLIGLRCCACLCAMLFMLIFGPFVFAEGDSSDNSNLIFHFGFSSSMISDVSQNEVEAAMRVWAQALTAESGFPMDTDPKALNGLEAISRAVRDKLVDAIALTTPEYWRLKGEIQSPVIIAAVYGGTINEQYLLLVHRDSRIESVRDLRGRTLGVYVSPRTSLAVPWLDLVLSKIGQNSTKEFCRLKESTKISQTVLPVFFRQADACLVNRRGFETMSELNPQLGQFLKVLASSPELVPAGLCFRKDYAGPLKDRVMQETANVHMTPAGRQILTIFHSGNLEVHPVSCLDPAFELLETHSRLSASKGNVHEKTTAIITDNTDRR